MIPHLSYSQFSDYKRCPRSWYLSKIRGAESKQTWYVPIGSAVHEMIEDTLAATLPFSPAVEDYLYPIVAKQRLIEPDTTKWLAGGPKDNPVTEARAVARAQECYEKALTYLSELDVWEVEYDASGSLPGLSVPLKAFVDIIAEHKKRGPVIVDWKTGSTKPDNFQLETYAALLKGVDKYCNTYFAGKYAMISPTYTSDTRYVDLSKVDPAEVGAKYQKVLDSMEKKLYLAKEGFNCRFCFNQENCIANAGPTERATYYDRSAEDGFTF